MQDNNVKVFCDVCRKEIDAKPKHEKTIINAVSYKVTFLACENCGKVYPSVICDNESDKMIEELQRLQSRLKKVYTKTDALTHDAKRLKDTIEAKRNKLKTKMQRTENIIGKGEFVLTDSGLEFKPCVLKI